MILKYCAWRLISKCYVWLASGERQTQCFETTLQTQRFKIRRQAQHFKIFRQTPFSVTMHQTCIMSGIHWYWGNVRNEQSQHLVWDSVKICEKWTGEGQLIIMISIVLGLFISHKFKQNQTQNVDSVHFSQKPNISDSVVLLVWHIIKWLMYHNSKTLPSITDRKWLLETDRICYLAWWGTDRK